MNRQAAPANPYYPGRFGRSGCGAKGEEDWLQNGGETAWQQVTSWSHLSSGCTTQLEMNRDLPVHSLEGIMAHEWEQKEVEEV